jgi:peptidoglycan/xylan/chitin deacetylase (PgdA/CDA1 family)
MTSFFVNSAVIVVNYHYCLDSSENPYLAKTAVSPRNFDSQIKQLSLLRERKGIDSYVTFDDGASGIWRNALPVLTRHEMPSTLFICTKPLLERRVLNVTKIHLLQAKLGLEMFRSRFMSSLDLVKEKYELDDPESIGLEQTNRYDAPEVKEFKVLLNAKLPYRIVTERLDLIFESEFGPQENAVKALYMSPDEICRARDLGVTIGLHSHSHPIMSRLESNEQEYEIKTCRDYLSDILGDQMMSFSYPSGVRGAWTNETKKILTSKGITNAYTLGRTLYDPSDLFDPLEIPRYDVNDVFHRGTASLKLGSII